MGIFMVVLFAFLANIYTLGEAKEERTIRRFTRLAKILIVGLVIAGALVFTTAEISGHSLFYEFAHSPVSMGCVLLATMALPFLWVNLNKNKRNLLRAIAGFQTTMIVTGWFAIQFPVLVRINDGNHITLQGAAAPEQTQYYMLIALVVGVILIFPSIWYLYKTFKFNN
jgi:cytochrome d ubiquinol oxidase subunit II